MQAVLFCRVLLGFFLEKRLLKEKDGAWFKRRCFLIIDIFSKRHVVWWHLFYFS